jgi:putative membrane protein
VRSLAFAIALLALLTLACPSRQAETTTDTVSTSGTMATGTASKTSTGSTGGTVSTLNDSDKQFFISAAQMNMSELALSRIAADQATDSNVQNLAARMLADHQKLDQELKQFALKKGVALPTPVTSESLPKADLDHAYVQRMIRDHQKAIDQFSSAVLTDPDLRALAANTLPVLREHLAAAKKITAP